MYQINVIEVIVNEFLQSLGGWLRAPMLAITALGYEEFFVLLLPTLYWCFDQMVGLRVGIALLLANSTNAFFKFLMQGPRPYWISEKVRALSHETSFGIPSGHAQIAASVWGWLAVEVNKRWFKILSVIIIFMIGFSRLYLGVHFLSDVLMGWLLGGLLVWAMFAWHKPMGAWLGKQSPWAKIGLIAASAALFVLLAFGAKWLAGPWEINPDWVDRAGEVNPYNLDGIFTAAGTWFGMLSGFVILTQTRGRFLADQGGWRRVVRFVVGLIGILILYIGLGQVFPRGANFVGFGFRFLRYTLIGWWVAWLGPLAFEKMRLLDFERQVQK